MTAPRRCPKCGVGLLGPYDEECICCQARKWMGITHAPRSHVPVVLDPDGNDAPAAVMAGEEETP